MDLLRTDVVIEIAGLPLHPLIVHAVVVITPLTVLALLLGTFWPAARRRLGIVTPLAALLVLVLVPITTAAGESLADLVGETDAVDHHEDLGELLLPWVIGLFAVAAAQWAWYRWGRERAAKRSATVARVVTIVIGAIAVLVGVATTVLVVLIGDSGARAVWGGIVGD